MSVSTRVWRRLGVGLLGAAVLCACSDSSGPSDTTIALSLAAIPSATNQPNLQITGSTDPNSRVTVTAPIDTATGDATASGSFALSVALSLNAANQIEVRARDGAGNVAADTFNVLHDNVAPTISFAAPSGATPTAGQSGFTVSLSFGDGASGIDPASFTISADRQLGGAFKQDGTFSTIIGAGEELAGVFGSVNASGANLTVPDSLFFPAGAATLTAAIEDAAGNSAGADRTFTVTADPAELVVVNTQVSAGSTENPIFVGIANGDPVGGVQFDVIYDPAVIASVDSVTVQDRASGFDQPPFNQIAPGQVRVLVFDSGGADIPGGQGPILAIWVTIDAAASGSHTVSLESIVISDDSGGTSAAPVATGQIDVS